MKSERNETTEKKKPTKKKTKEKPLLDFATQMLSTIIISLLFFQRDHQKLSPDLQCIKK